MGIKSGKHRILIILLGITILMIVIGGYFFLKFSDQIANTGIPSSILNKSKFKLYYPKQLPAGMVLNKDSFSGTNQVVTFNFDYDKDKKLIVSEQPLTDKTIPDSFNPTKKVTTSIGTGYIVEMDDRVTAAVVGDNSWLIVNAPNKIGVDVMEEFLKNLQPVN